MHAKLSYKKYTGYKKAFEPWTKRAKVTRILLNRCDVLLHAKLGDGISELWDIL